MTHTRWNRYVAVGDSITEGFCDPVLGTGEPWLGWADRLALILDGSASLAHEEFEFANLAVRGRRVEDVVSVQIPQALSLRPDLVSVMIGGNDLMAARADPDRLAARLDEGVGALRAAGVDVLLSTIFDPQFAVFMRPFRGRAAVFNANLWSIARTHGTFTLDLWGTRELQDRAMWSDDRIHLTPAGHRLLAKRAANALEVPYFEVGTQPSPMGPPPTSDLHWLRMHALPWVGRRLRKVSLGDGRVAKLPVPIRLSTAAVSVPDPSPAQR